MKATITIKDPAIKPDEKPTRFPAISLPAPAIKAAMLFQAQGDIRYYLNGILLDPAGFIVATNGHYLIKIACKEVKRLKQKYVINIYGAKIPAKADRVHFHPDKNGELGTITMSNSIDQIMDQSRFFRVVENGGKQYPDYDRVIPCRKTNPPKAVEKISFNMDYAATIAEAMKALSPGMKQPCAILYFMGEDKSIRVSPQSISFDVDIILMPARI